MLRLNIIKLIHVPNIILHSQFLFAAWMLYWMHYASKQHTTSQSAPFVQASSKKEDRCVTLVEAIYLVACHLSNSVTLCKVEFTSRVTAVAMLLDLERFTSPQMGTAILFCHRLTETSHLKLITDRSYLIFYPITPVSVPYPLSSVVTQDGS